MPEAPTVAERSVPIPTPVSAALSPAGVPYLLRQKWAPIRGFLTGAYRVKPFCNKTLRLNIGDETKIAAALEAAASALGRDVNIGSYPVSSTGYSCLPSRPSLPPSLPAGCQHN